MSDLNELFEDPSANVEHFQSTYSRLKSSPDVDPPRRLMFEFEKPQRPSWLWHWLAPMAASAAVAFAVVTLTPRPQAPPSTVERVVEKQVQVPSPAATPVDYQRQIDELRAELNTKNLFQTKEFQRIRGGMDELAADQLALRRENIKNGGEIQMVAAKLPPNLLRNQQ